MKRIEYSVPNFPQLDGQASAIVRDFKGLNTFDPLSIPDNYFTDVSNVSTEDYPAIKTRKGFTQLNNIGSEIIGMAVHKGKDLHVIAKDGTWRKYVPDTSTWSLVGSSMNTQGRYSFTNFEGNLPDINLFACNGYSGLYKYDGNTLSPHGNAPADINFITTYQNRLWGASKNTLHASKLDDSSRWQTFAGNADDSFFKTIESKRGENISMLSGGLSKLIIGMPNQTNELYGGLPQDFADRIVSEDNGFINNFSHTTNNGTLFGVHYTGIYTYSGGTLPSKAIYDVIGRYNIDLTQSRCALSHDDYVYFSIDDKVLVFDSRGEVYSWTVFEGHEVTHMTVLGNKVIFGTKEGLVLQHEGDNDPFPNNLIPYKIITKAFNNNSLANKERIYKLYLTVDMKQNSTMNVYLSADIEGESWELVHSSTATSIGTKRILIPLGKFALERWVRVKIEGVGQIKLYEINRQFRDLPL